MSAQDSCIRCNEPVMEVKGGNIAHMIAEFCKPFIGWWLNAAKTDWCCQECVNTSTGILLPVAESVQVTHQGKCMYFALYTQKAFLTIGGYY